MNAPASRCCRQPLQVSQVGWPGGLHVLQQDRKLPGSLGLAVDLLRRTVLLDHVQEIVHNPHIRGE